MGHEIWSDPYCCGEKRSGSMGCGCHEGPGANVRVVIISVAEMEVVIISKQTLQNRLLASLILGLFERQDELPSTGSGAWLWHVCNLIILGLP